MYWESSIEVHEEKRAKTATFKISFELRVISAAWVSGRDLGWGEVGGGVLFWYFQDENFVITFCQSHLESW